MTVSMPRAPGGNARVARQGRGAARSLARQLARREGGLLHGTLAAFGHAGDDVFDRLGDCFGNRLNGDR
jgi:hypothetical protein